MQPYEPEPMPSLAEVLDASNDGFAIYDSQDRFVLGNRRYRQIQTLIADLLVPGTPVTDLIRGLATRGAVRVPDDQLDAFVAGLLVTFRELGPPYIRQLADQRWYRVTYTRLPGGGTLVENTDITELVAARDRLRDAIEDVAEGLAIFDAEERLVEINRHAAAWLMGASDAPVTGSTLAALMQTAQARGHVPVVEEGATPLSGEAAIARRLALHRAAPERHFEISAEGARLEVCTCPGAGGGTVVTWLPAELVPTLPSL